MLQLHLAFEHCCVNLIEKVIGDFSKNAVSAVPFFVAAYVSPYFWNKYSLYTGDYCF